MNELAVKFIGDHKNPIVKVDLPGTKLFLKSSTPEEFDFVEGHQKHFENLLRHDRTERRCARAQAEWSSINKLAKVSKVLKALIHSFGYQDKCGVFLYPEETVYLMETNRLEVTNNNIPLSIQEGYDLLIRHNCRLINYRVYKKLVLLGYKVLRYEEILRRKMKDRKRNEVVDERVDNRKRVTEKCSEFESEIKKKCTERESFSDRKELDNKVVFESGSKTVDKKEVEIKYINGIFDKLRKTAPRQYRPINDSNEIPEYCIFLPNNKSRCDYDFNLFICDKPILEKRSHNYPTPAIFAICSEDNIAFYKFANVALPFL